MLTGTCSTDSSKCADTCAHTRRHMSQIQPRSQTGTHVLTHAHMVTDMITDLIHTTTHRGTDTELSSWAQTHDHSTHSDAHTRTQHREASRTERAHCHQCTNSYAHSCAHTYRSQTTDRHSYHVPTHAGCTFTVTRPHICGQVPPVMTHTASGIHTRQAHTQRQMARSPRTHTTTASHVGPPQPPLSAACHRAGEPAQPDLICQFFPEKLAIWVLCEIT